MERGGPIARISVSIALACALTSPAEAGPHRVDFPAGLLARVRAADFIVLAKLGPLSARSLPIRMQVLESWKGALRGSIDVELDGADPSKTGAAHTVVAFLVMRPPRNHWVAVSLYPRVEDVAVLRASIERALSLADAGTLDDPPVRAWLVEALAQRATRGQAFYDLFPSWPMNPRPALNRSFSDDELGALARGFAEGASPDETVLKMLTLLRSHAAADVDRVAYAGLEKAVASGCISSWVFPAYDLLLERLHLTDDEQLSIRWPGTAHADTFAEAWDRFRARVRLPAPSTSWGPSYGRRMSAPLATRKLKGLAGAHELARWCKRLEE